jgi:hypothetical protein
MRKAISTILLLVLLVSLAGIVTLSRTQHANTGNATVDSMTADQLGDALVRALDDRATYKTTSEDLQAALNEKVQYETVSINPNPVFTTGKASGNLEITNDGHNRYPQQMEIYVDDTHQLIYKGTVEVGSSIETDTLLVDLPKGQYSCTAHFRAVNPETGGGVRADLTGITITIQN